MASPRPIRPQGRRASKDTGRPGGPPTPGRSTGHAPVSKSAEVLAGLGGNQGTACGVGLDQKWIPSPNQQTYRTFQVPGMESVKSSGEAGNSGTPREVIKMWRSRSNERWALRIAKQVRTKERWGLPFGSRSPARQQALARAEVQIRNTGHAAPCGTPKRLDGIVRSEGRLLSCPNPSTSSMLPHNDARRPAGIIHRTAVRVINRTNGVYKGHETYGFGVTRAGYTGAPVPGRLPAHVSNASTGSGVKAQRGNTATTTRSEEKCDKRTLGTDATADPPGHRDRHSAWPLLSTSTKMDNAQGSSSKSVALWKKSLSLGQQEKACKRVWAGSVTSSCTSKCTGLDPKPVRYLGYNKGLDWRRENVIPDSSRFNDHRKPEHASKWNGDMEANTNSPVAHGRFRLRVGRGARQLRTRKRLLRCDTARAAHHGKRTASSVKRDEVMETSIPTASCSAMDGQHGGKSSHKQADVSLKTTYGNLSPCSETSDGERGTLASRVHTLKRKSCGRQFVAHDRASGLVVPPKFGPGLQCQIRAKIDRSIRDVKQQGVRPVQQLVRGAGVRRGRIRRIMAPGEKLGLPAVPTHRKSSVKITRRSRGGNRGSAILAVGVVVPSTHGDGRSMPDTDTARDTRSGCALGSTKASRTSQKQAVAAHDSARSGTSGRDAALRKYRMMAEELTMAAARPSTRRNYERVQLTYQNFCDSMSIPAYPVTFGSISVFVAKLVEQQLRPVSIKSYVSAVLKENTRRQHSVDMFFDNNLHELLRGVENHHISLNGPAPLKLIVTSQQVVQCMETLTDLANADVRTAKMAAIFGFMFASRASTILAVRVGDVCERGGVLHFTERLRKSKNVQTLRQLDIPIGRCSLAGSILQYCNWRKKHASDSEVLFPLRKAASGLDGTVMTNAMNLAFSDTAVLSSHALRRGAAVSMFAIGVPLPRILAWGGWASEESIKPYLDGRQWLQATTYDVQVFGWMKHEASSGLSSGTTADTHSMRSGKNKGDDNAASFFRSKRHKNSET